MDVLKKAAILGEAGSFDSCGPKACEVKVSKGLGGIYHAKAEHKTCRIFKTLMNNSCSYDCKYCQNSTSCTKQKTAYKPKELVTLFNYLERNLAVEGLFLSSGVAGDADKATEKMLEAVKLLRHKHNFKGYIHFKVLPGTSYELVKQASKLSTRMSINIEAPNKGVLSELSSCKDYKTDILRRQAWIRNLNLKGGQTTQMILNNLATDKDVLRMTEWEYTNLKLRRVYYSAFRPVQGTPLEKERPESIFRQNHLYNADFLLKQYNYKTKDLYPIMEDGMLPRTQDPKTALAIATFDSPIDINEASYEELIRIPGIGPKTAQRIRDSNKRIESYRDLHEFGAWIQRAKPFIEVNGTRQKMLMEF